MEGKVVICIIYRQVPVESKHYQQNFENKRLHQFVKNIGRLEQVKVVKI